MKDPARYLRGLGADFPCPVHANHAAVLDSSLVAFVNREVYVFSDRKSLGRFKKDPLKYCDELTDPVTEMRFHPTRRAPRVEHDGRPYFFSSDSTRVMFAAMPDSFATRRARMRP